MVIERFGAEYWHSCQMLISLRDEHQDRCSGKQGQNALIQNRVIRLKGRLLISMLFSSDIFGEFERASENLRAANAHVIGRYFQKN